MNIFCQKSEYLLENMWLKVRRDSLIINGEKPADYYVVEKNDVVLILAFNQDNEILLVTEYKYPVNQTMTGIPGGTMIRGTEDPLSAAKRELKEETGFESGDWEFFIKTYEYPTKDTHELFVYIAKGCVQTSGQNLDENEELTYKWMPFGDAVSLVINGEVNHGCTAYAILRCSVMYPELLNAAKD